MLTNVYVHSDLHNYIIAYKQDNKHQWDINLG